MNTLEKELIKRSLESHDMDFQGFKFQVFHRGQKQMSIEVGKTYSFYDVASLTKIIFSTLYFMDAVEQKKIKITDSVSLHLPWYKHKQVLIENLLNHSAGHQWWQPYYKDIDLSLTGAEKYQQLLKLCQNTPRKKNAKSLYSDLDFFVLGALMEKIEKKPLLLIWENLKRKYLNNTQFHFNTDQQKKMSTSSYAPTESCPWRKKTLRGEVHDENAWALGGVAPHAGLFGRIEDLSQYGLLLRNHLLMSENNFFSPQVFKKFTSRSMSEKKGDWGLGFMLPSQKNSSAGNRLSRKSFGHTGFTGTSFWIDPERDLIFSLLSNRVHPSREQKGFIRLRPKLHDWAVEILGV